MFPIFVLLFVSQSERATNRPEDRWVLLKGLKSYGESLKYRMDGSDVESRHGLYKGQCGLQKCYAERLAYRLQAMGNRRYHNGFRVTLHEDLIDFPKRWREPRLIFVNSMSDLFHEASAARVHPTSVCDDARLPAAHIPNSNKAKRRLKDLLQKSIGRQTSGWA
jgi:hypothetical protein